jgi:putative acetyltransferase
VSLLSPTRLGIEEAGAASRVHRTAFKAELPWLADLHTPEEDEAFYREHVFKTSEVFGIHADDQLIAVIALSPGWIEQLYVLPTFQGRGAGSALLKLAQSQSEHLTLWTFQKNAKARAFYERHGFMPVEFTDGSTNEEREPDVRYVWDRRDPR